jgi:uncharacterized membrane protein
VRPAMGRKSQEQSPGAWEGRLMPGGARRVTFPVMMILAFKVVLWAHILAGAVALSVFWLPLVTKKGGATHRRAGWVYVVAAAAIAVTSFVNCARMLTDGNPRNDRAALFLAYIGVLAAASAQIGIRALRTKQRTSGSRSPERGFGGAAPIVNSPVDLALPALLVAGGLALAALGLSVGRPLFVVFAALGLAQGAAQLRFWLRAPATSREWFYAHMTGMGTSCITTVTAFLVVNAHRFGVGTFDLVVWVAPATLGGVGLTLWKKVYERRFARGRVALHTDPIGQIVVDGGAPT